MALLNYDVLKKSGYDGYILEDAPVKVLQFGEGNFLRAFVDYWFDLANEKAGWNGKCCLVQPIAPGLSKMINEQEGLYTLYLRGSENGKKVDDKRVISSVANCLNPYEKADYDKMMEVADPVGLIMGIVPSTNPTSTAIFKTLISLKTRNGIIISPHPRAKKCTIEAAKVVLDAAVAAGAP